ncbi:MAG: hypothetical protein P8017_13795 [Deltaproteobacteria bacterium]
MADKIRIGYFLEDRGHEILLKAFVARVAMEKGLKAGEWLDDVGAPIPFDILVVASDGNCKGYTKKKNQLLGYAERAKFPKFDILVFAVPNPHIERWYMNDPSGFKRAVGSGAAPVLPAYKCEKGLYKKVMRDAIVSSGITPQFGGYEYGEKIVEEMDFYSATKADRSLGHFIGDLRGAFTRLATTDI